MSTETGNVDRRLRHAQAAFEPQFAEYFDRLRNDFDGPSNSTYVGECLDLIQDLSLRGGKRQRVAFLEEASSLVSAESLDGSVESAISIELLQTHLLIHDDLIDDSPLRRGAPTTYYSYLAKYPEHPKVSLGLTILAGDIAAYLALDVLHRSSLSATVLTPLLDIQTRAGLATFAGQLFDLERDMITDVSEEMLFELADYKAARSSSVAPMEMGLSLAGGLDDVARDRIRRYSQLFGVASQLHDDFLGMFGDEAEMGKSATSDMREGRRTFLVKRAYEVASAAESAVLRATLGNADAPDSAFDDVRSIVSSHGLDREILAIERGYAEQATEEARSWANTWREEPVRFFSELPLWSVERAL